jgi:hypothetical protein
MPESLYGIGFSAAEKPLPSGHGENSSFTGKESAHRHPFWRCPHNEQKGTSDEQIQRNVAYDLALRVPHHVDAKISVSGDAREGERGGGDAQRKLKFSSDVIPSSGGLGMICPPSGQGQWGLGQYGGVDDHQTTIPTTDE